MPSVSTTSLSIRSLFRWFDDRVLAVPEIQREFVWNATRACALLDSMYRGYPVGSAMIWKTGRQQKDMLRHSLHVLPPYDPQNRELYFLIDGQQRLSVLHLVREGKVITNSDGKRIDFGAICFDVTSEDEPFVTVRRPDTSVHLPVSDLLSSGWRQKFRRLPAYKLKRARDCRDRILSYQLFIQFLDAKELSDVRETFIRINTQGMRITEADKAFTSASKVKPIHLFRNLCGQLKDGFEKIHKNIYWTALALVHGSKETGQRAFARLAAYFNTPEGGKWYAREEPRIAESIRLAADHLTSSLKAGSYQSVPYTQMISLLACFFYWNNRAQPSKLQRDQIRHWFWHTAVANRYAGSGYQRNMLEDAAFFRRLGETRKGRYLITARTPAEELIREQYRGSSALSKAFRLLLMQHGPRYIDSGDTIPVGPVSSARNARELHHIWPRDLLRRQGIKATRINSLCNICYLVAQNNRSFGARHPSDYLDQWRRKKHFAAAMKSHFIPSATQSPLWDDNVNRGFTAFLKIRQSLLAQAFNKAAGTRIISTRSQA